MKFIELFAGIGGFRYGLERVAQISGAEKNREADSTDQGSANYIGDSLQERRQSAFTCVWSNEWDKYACQIYRRNYGHRVCIENEGQPKEASLGDQEGQSGELSNASTEGQYDCPELYEGDITRVDTKDIPDHDLLVGGFPCQAFSIAGKRCGFSDGRGTLFFEIVRILRDKKPRCVLLENVKGLLSHDSGQTFQTILRLLSDCGYRTEWQVLNSKDFGVPQNRERVFIIGHLRGTCRRQIFPVRQDGIQNTKPHFIVPTITAREGQDMGTYLRNQAWEGESEGQVQQEHRIRRLTPTECERLQGFPDGWTEGISDTQRYKCLGNAVTTNVITAIGERLGG